jgi:hypothetical protein
MGTFKNIRTSILPYGYNQATKSFRFSLCIDLNPNYSDTQAELDSDELRKFSKIMPTEQIQFLLN